MDASSSSGESADLNLPELDNRSDDSDSGESDVDAFHARPRTDRSVMRAKEAQLQAARQCSLCEDELATYKCGQCGGIEYCTPCCIRMHNNRYLNLHRIERLLDDVTVDAESLWRNNKAKSEHGDEDHDDASAPKVTIAITSPLHPEFSDSERCRFHTSIPIDMYCMSCDVPVCSSCGVQGERHCVCTLVPIKVKLRTEQEILHNRVIQLKDMRDKLALLQSKLVEEKHVTKSQLLSVCSNVATHFQTIRKALDDAEQRMLDQVNAAATERNTVIEGQNIAVSDTLCDVDMFLKDAENALVSSSENVMSLLPKRLDLLNNSTETIDKASHFHSFSSTQFEKVKAISIYRTVNYEPVLMEIHKLRCMEEDWRQNVAPVELLLPTASKKKPTGSAPTTPTLNNNNNNDTVSMASSAGLSGGASLTLQEFHTTAKVWTPQQNPSVGMVANGNTQPPPVLQKGKLIELGISLLPNSSRNTEVGSVGASSRGSSPVRRAPLSASLLDKGIPKTPSPARGAPAAPSIASTSASAKDVIKNRIVASLQQHQTRPASPSRITAPLHSVQLDNIRLRAHSPQRYPSPMGSITRPTLLDCPRAPRPGTPTREVLSSPKRDAVVPGPGAYNVAPARLRTTPSRANSPTNKAR
eukprot:PhF_6_TR2345/c0_g1_i1/m.4201